MKNGIFAALTAIFLLGAPPGAATQVASPPLAVAESEHFEAVARLEDEGLRWYIDRSESNAPVLDAQLEVEAGGRTARAVFRPLQGDYLIADTDWLAPLRLPGRHPLALTLMAGEESDLLVAELTVPALPEGGEAGMSRWLAGVAAAVLLAGLGRFTWRWGKK